MYILCSLEIIPRASSLSSLNSPYNSLEDPMSPIGSLVKLGPVGSLQAPLDTQFPNRSRPPCYRPSSINKFLCLLVYATEMSKKPRGAKTIINGGCYDLSLSHTKEMNLKENFLNT